MTEVRGFIVSAWEEPTTARRAGAPGRILMTGRLEDGRSFAAMIPAPPAALFVPAPTAEEASAVVKARASSATLDPVMWTSQEGVPLARLMLDEPHAGAAERRLEAARIPVIARQTVRAADALLALDLQGPVSLVGDAVPGRRVDLVFVDPKLTPCATDTTLRWLSIDLETDRDGRVVAASLAGADGPGEVLFLGPHLTAANVTSYDTEAALLAALARRIVERDPDVITGWNVLDFDLRVLADRFAAQKLALDLGRTSEPAAFLEREGRRTMFRLPGRAVIDAMRLVRASGDRFDDLSLESVARTLLGEGKTVDARGEAKLDELDRLRREEPDAFCAYCLQDAELVLRILEKTGLDVLTAKRSALTGVSLELAWTSIPAFERIYAAELRKRRVLPPPKATRRVSGAAGGTVLDAHAGFFSNVLVFDFRSLYPSIMRTFNIDPMANARAEAHPADDDLIAPNGARFTRTQGVLPGIVTRYAHEREASLEAGDETAAYVYKILQNSFYGVLGAEGCRYARTELAGAITSFGKLFLTAARDHFEQAGTRVLYGDTDSVFVLSALGEEAGFDELTAEGARAADELNALLATRIEDTWGVESHLKIRCEKAYRRFFIPRLKGDPSAEGRGRAKGYAGLRLSADGVALEVRGMEAARSDFTPLARRFQTELLSLAFADACEEALQAYCVVLLAKLQRGELDEELVYRKSLRRPAGEYETETPQVRAARLLGWTERRGRISYVMTVAGAEPVEARSGAPLDLAHYVDRQLLPIARSIADGLGYDARRWFGAATQLDLFEP